MKDPECESNGCYMFAPDSEERKKCELACRLLSRHSDRTPQEPAVSHEPASLLDLEPSLTNWSLKDW
jgi:hypothetical protein